MANNSPDSSAYVRGIRFVGRTAGAVKTLGGFRKGLHTVPDAVTPATNAFLARLSTGELETEAEAFFQRARVAGGYKRRELSLAVVAPLATLATKDFTLELAYALVADDPACYERLLTLSGVSERDFLRGPVCGEIFGDSFEELVFQLTKGAQVEAVIDAVEALARSPLEISYPSDCSHCLLTVAGVDAAVRFDGATLAMVFPRKGAPAELLDGFLAVREAFALTRSEFLSGLLA
ncbi:MAG: hypothetical protein HZA31_08745 [Opitutae bacterium]|nr:hypothetical protein [Opitutae bacterium]